MAPRRRSATARRAVRVRGAPTYHGSTVSLLTVLTPLQYLRYLRYSLCVYEALGGRRAADVHERLIGNQNVVFNRVASELAQARGLGAL